MSKWREPEITVIIRGALVLRIIKVLWPNVRQQPVLKGNASASSVLVDYTPLCFLAAEHSACVHVNGVKGVKGGLRGMSVPS